MLIKRLLFYNEKVQIDRSRLASSSNVVADRTGLAAAQAGTAGPCSSTAIGFNWDGKDLRTYESYIKRKKNLKEGNGILK